jgi:ABC-type tungstate transport system permease subunit
VEGERLDVILQLDVVEASYELAHRDPQVHARQVGAGTAMRAGAECDVAVARATQVERLRAAEFRLVPVG